MLVAVILTGFVCFLCPGMSTAFSSAHWTPRTDSVEQECSTR